MEHKGEEILRDSSDPKDPKDRDNEERRGELEKASPTPDPLFRYFPNTEFPFESHQPAAGYLTTRGIKRIKEGRNCRLTLSFPTCRALDSSMESSAVDNESVSTPVDESTENKEKKKERQRKERRERKFRE